MADINIGQFSEALNDKMDLDAGNANPPIVRQSDIIALQNTIATLQQQVAQLQGEMSKMLGRIDYSNAVTIEFKASSTSYTCPKNGYIRWDSYAVNQGDYNILINGKKVRKVDGNSNVGNQDVFYPVSEGDILSTSQNWQVFGGSVFFMFYPQKS